MKETLKKISKVCKTVFGYGIMITLFAGGLTFIGYLVAFFIGGETATAICTFIYKQIVPIIVYITSILVLLGLLAMYLAGEKALTPGKNSKRKETASGSIEQ